jgi:translation initiation factor eIF-2B subunit gamma
MATTAFPSTQKLALSLSTTQAPESKESEQGEWKSPVRCKAFVLPKEIYCGRANTIPNYFETNRYVSDDFQSQ